MRILIKPEQFEGNYFVHERPTPARTTLSIWSLCNRTSMSSIKHSERIEKNLPWTNYGNESEVITMSTGIGNWSQDCCCGRTDCLSEADDFTFSGDYYSEPRLFWGLLTVCDLGPICKGNSHNSYHRAVDSALLNDAISNMKRWYALG